MREQTKDDVRGLKMDPGQEEQLCADKGSYDKQTVEQVWVQKQKSWSWHEFK